MTAHAARYAVYALPGALGSDDARESVRLRALAESWFARDDLDLQHLTTSARRYGFHATLKAPFRLAAGRTEDELKAAASAFASAQSTVVIPDISPRVIGTYRALRPAGDESLLNEFAARVVSEFDSFRAPLTAAEIARRQPEHMTSRQRELFEQWGYPYVFDEFRLHLTLTDRIPEARSAAIDAALKEHFAEITGASVPLHSIALFVEPEPGAPFEILSVHPFSGSTEASPAVATEARPDAATEAGLDAAAPGAVTAHPHTSPTQPPAPHTMEIA